ncbi:polysaccharide deacetylase family protein [Reichenbachiella agarivorans]|uniref:Polysaccharide deacetylase family protein n=1 Tax=Reichenbachiella agarivorans TaxID=2979464 RepID=A0ABY6CJS4_9BACT|nr:polysaccharide deacetylase family protein [Reichenbachiella agarivorans]UXP30772.1 polysaccharide deacetylase family protein [Reichenbachiella agarivorans]
MTHNLAALLSSVVSRFYITLILFLSFQFTFLFWVDPEHFLAYIILSVLVFMILVFVMSLLIRTNFFLQAQHKLDSDHVMLTFDDGPHPINTHRTLDILKEKGVKAMFFLIGKNVEQYPDVVERIVQEGHLVGGHSYSHQFSFGFIMGRELNREILRTQKILSEITGQEEKYFRPPFGVTNAHIAYVVKAHALKTIGWSLRTYDTATDFTSKKINQIIQKTRRGSIVLLHERMDSTCDALPLLIDGIRNKGMEFGLLTPRNETAK